ncbi:hypothetical protein LJC23_00090 [Desulfovibrio sp. OttesenSCG-928-I05]|nr:hypothetical protein [Desulfovibrio sp. OttesenSCG-928-O18]MDL2271415.1 hypothetical protein [Desulfovibrio sp. OttesenSCG-928-I05]
MRSLLLPLLLFAVLFASGCAGKGFHGSYYGEVPQNAAPSMIAADAAGYVVGLYPPGHTKLQILNAEKADNAFAIAFENGLRGEGFTILSATGVPADADGCVAVAYTLDVLEKDAAYYLQLRFSDGKAVSRAYSASGQPEAGRSATPHDFKRPLLKRVEEKARRAYSSTVDKFGGDNDR